MNDDKPDPLSIDESIIAGSIPPRGGPGDPIEIHRGPGQVELKAVVGRVTYFNPETGWCVAQLRTKPPRTVCGPSGTGDQLESGFPYRFLGKWEDHPRHGLQFRFQVAIRDVPNSLYAMLAYRARRLSNLRSPDGVRLTFGQAALTRLYDHYGSDLFSAVTDNPEEAADIAGVSLATIAAVAGVVGTDQAERDARLGLYGLFKGFGMPNTAVDECITFFGAAAVDMIRANPYVLLEARISGCGFKRVDSLYMHLGHDPKSPVRAAYCAWSLPHADRSGHTWFSRAEVREYVTQKLGLTQRDLSRAGQAVKEAVARGLLAERRDEHDVYWTALRSNDDDEVMIAERIVTLMSAPAVHWPDPDALAGLTTHQREGLRDAFRSSVCVVSGSPGTGKSTCAMAAVRAMHAAGKRIAVCGPTGRSAVRCTELLAGVTGGRATTIHSLLDFQWGPRGGRFNYGPGQHLSLDVIVVDEASMCDTPLFASLLSALIRGTHLMIVGDPDQLPPVGHGAPLRDLLAAGVPVCRLREPHRNAGLIAEICRDIRDRVPFDLPSGVPDLPYVNVQHTQISTAGQIKEQVKRMLEKRIQHYAERPDNGIPHWHPIDDIQIICALNDGGPASRRHLNLIAQAILNRHGVVITRSTVAEGGTARAAAEANTAWRMGDKIVCMKNGHHEVVEFSPTWDAARSGGRLNPDDFHRVSFTSEDGRRLTRHAFVANGDTGRIVAYGPHEMIVRFLAPDRTVRVPHRTFKTESDSDAESEAAASDFDLGYVVTAHKFQGAEAPLVIVILDPDSRASHVASRQWVYTAISRARQMCMLVGPREALDLWLHRDRLGERKTFLAERLREEAAERFGDGWLESRRRPHGV